MGCATLLPFTLSPPQVSPPLPCFNPTLPHTPPPPRLPHTASYSWLTLPLSFLTHDFNRHVKDTVRGNGEDWWDCCRGTLQWKWRKYKWDFVFFMSHQINWQRQRELWREAARSKSLCGCDQRRISEPSAAFKSSDGLKAVFDFPRVSFIIKLLWPELIWELLRIASLICRIDDYSKTQMLCHNSLSPSSSSSLFYFLVPDSWHCDIRQKASSLSASSCSCSFTPLYSAWQVQ